MFNFQARLATWGGRTWADPTLLALFPWPAVVFGHSRYFCDEDDYRRFTAYIKPGDFIITKSRQFFLSNYFISGTAFKHLAVYTGPVHGDKDRNTGFISIPKSLGAKRVHRGIRDNANTHERTVTHAIAEGLVTQDLLRVLLHCDYAAAIRAWTTPEQQETIVNAALSCVGMDYNFDFDDNEQHGALYCTQLGRFCLKKAGIEPPSMDEITTSLLGKKAPVTLADSFLKYPMMCCSFSCREKNFIRSGKMAEVLRQAILNTGD